MRAGRTGWRHPARALPPLPAATAAPRLRARRPAGVPGCSPRWGPRAVDQWVESRLEFADWLVRELGALRERCGGDALGTVAEVTSGAGDSHRGGRSVAVVRSAGNHPARAVELTDNDLSDSTEVHHFSVRHSGDLEAGALPEPHLLPGIAPSAMGHAPSPPGGAAAAPRTGTAGGKTAGVWSRYPPGPHPVHVAALCDGGQCRVSSQAEP
ncbi:type 2 lantipeptide synthetase LanM [Streptomyces werraensis]|uniref:type 2 lantipeptide synthetase LanM n=1 Tax=Streptomyces werraensis TaxID=68284 RepID=UPI001CE3051C